MIKTIIVGIGTLIALITYITNSVNNFRNKNIENIDRYLKAKKELFDDDGFIMSNIKEMENGTFTRDSNNKDMEKKFNQLLGGIEHIALLTSHKAVPTSIQVYMFGWFARKIQLMITIDERQNQFWDLAVSYIDELVKATDDYEKLPTFEKEKILKKDRFNYKKLK
ncbi:hypothetical protein [Acinetobacter sp. ANC 5502]